MKRQNLIGLFFVILIVFLAVRSNATCPLLKGEKRAVSVVSATTLDVR